MRVWLAAGASAMAVSAVLVSALDNAQEAFAFFVVTAIIAAVQAYSVHEPYAGGRRRVAIGIAAVWLVAAAWIGALLVMYQSASRTPLGPDATYLGLTATLYHLVALYGGAALVTIAAFLPRGWVRAGDRQPASA